MYKKEILPDVTNFEENKKKKNAGNRMGLRANQIKSLNKKTKTNTGFVIKALRGLLPLLPKRILIKFLVVRFVTGIVTRMITTLERLLSNGLRAPVLIIGLATLGIWLVVPISFALSSYISTAATPCTTYPSSPSQLHASSCAAPATTWSWPAALREVCSPSGCPRAATSSGRGGSAPCAPAPAPPPAWGLEVIVPIVGVIVATAVVVIVIAVVIVVVLVTVVVRRVGVAASVPSSTPISAGRGHVGRGRVVVIVIVPDESKTARVRKTGLTKTKL